MDRMTWPLTKNPFLPRSCTFHPDVDVGDQVPARETLQLLPLVESVHGPDDYVAPLEVIETTLLTLGARL